MEIQYDKKKRAIVLEDRGLDIARSDEVFNGFHLTRRDDRHSNIEEERFTSLGVLDDEVVLVIWTARDAVRRIVTMWKANGKERERFQAERSRSG